MTKLVFIFIGMNYYLVVIFSSSIFIGTLIGWLRFKKTEPAFFPFIICLSVASLNEIISFVITVKGYSTAYNNNIYVLLEALLITWQFKKWGLFNQYKGAYHAVMIIIVITWVAENLFMYKIAAVSFYFRIGYSFIIVLMSIHINNNLILTFRNNLLKSPEFLICSGFIIYFTYKILIEAFWLYGLNAGRDFRINVYLLLTWINLFVNLIYAAALLWIPKKPQHITLS